MSRLRLTRGKTILLITLLLNLAFIFVHASFPPSVSGAEIDAVGGVIGGIISPNGGFGAFLQRNVGNIAHFCEYGLLGFQIAIGIFLWSGQKVKTAAVSVCLAAAVAFFDETVQIFSGRHSSILDMWIDVFGFSFVLTVLLSALVAIKVVKKKRAEGSRGKE